jgi:Zn-dependent protease with chaperone function
MSEFSADRAGLLACQNPEAAIDTVIKMAGVPQKYFSSVSHEAFLEQAKEFEYLLSGAESVIKNISVLDNTHPWTVLRAAELIKWIESGEYERILNRFAANTCQYCHSEIPQGRTECPVCGRSI